MPLNKDTCRKISLVTLMYFAIILQSLKLKGFNSLVSIYFREHLNSDMKDPELIYWTKPPGVFLVATTESGKIVGCICYEQISADTVEMHRLAVDGEFRGLKIGRKLVQALIDTAKENGYDNLYLETSNAQINANQLYQKMNFEFLRFMGLGPGPEWYFTYLSGIKVVCYTMQLK